MLGLMVSGGIYHRGKGAKEFIVWDYVAEAQRIMADQEVENRTGKRGLLMASFFQLHCVP